MTILRRPLRMVLGLFALTFVLGGSLLLSNAVSAGAVSYTPPVIDTKPVTAPSGSMTLNGSGFIPFSTVAISIGGAPLGTATTSANGTFSFNFTAPTNLGTYQLSATDGTNDLTTSFRVVADGGGGGGGGLPFTGSSSSSWLTQLGVGLLALGAIVVALVRSRSRKTAEERVDSHI